MWWKRPVHWLLCCAHRLHAAATWHITVLGDLAAVEDLLDWLEARGYAERRLSVLGDAAFEVRWR